MKTKEEITKEVETIAQDKDILGDEKLTEECRDFCINLIHDLYSRKFSFSREQEIFNSGIVYDPANFKVNCVRLSIFGEFKDMNSVLMIAAVIMEYSMKYH